MAFNCFGDLGRSCWGYKLKLDSKDDGVDLCKDIKNFRLFSQEELQVATKNYSRRIGEGGFGSVYKGILKDGTEVAIKRLSRHRFDERREDFLSLIGILSCIRHRNLVQFIGCCLEKDILMVYEYVDNGNLSSFLFDSAVRSALDWPTRAAICIGTARGLVYLHEEIRPRIIHHDIKPGTILLDKNFTPRISDFEISRFLDDDFSHCSDEICGTMGYLDPEYLTSGRVTEKVDVFAFGILVLEVISGKRNSATNFDTEKRTSLVDWVWQLRENDRLLDMVDPAVVYFPEDEVINFINAALVCVQVPSNLRPRMSEVLLMLSGHYNFRGQVLRKPTQGWVPSYSHHCDTDPDLDLSFSPDQMSIREDLDDLQDLSRKEILHGKGVQSFKAPSADDVFSVNKFGKGNGSGKAECTEIKNESCLVVEDEEVMIPVSKTEIDLISFESECQSVHSNAADLITHPERSFQLNTTAAGALSGPSNELMQPEMMTGSMEPDVLYPNKADGMISFQTKSQFQEGVDLPPKVNTNQSIEFTVQEILRAFKDVQVRRIGVYGKGGIGKTTVLKTLFDHPETKNLFNLVIWVTMSRNSYRRKLQDQIIQQLSLQLHTDSEDEIAKVILNYLNGRKFLLLLDDVWEPINLHEIGFPSPAEENGWRLVLASRYVDVCLGMADRKFEVKVLSRLESWELFCLQVGEVVDFPEIQPYAQAIIEECGGLPLIIIVTGKALRMESNVLEWKLALKKFLLPTAVNDGQSVSPQLKFCYDRLESRDVKSCFLCSALFLEDKMFNVSELVEFFIDEGLLAGTIETAFERGHDVVRHLVDASLLEVSQDGKMVKMHHVVRDMALGILSLETATCQLLVKSDFGLSELPRLEREVDGSFEKSSSAAESAETFGTAEILPPDQYMTRAGGGLREPPAEEEWERAKMIFLMCNNLSSLPARPSCLNLSVLLLQNNFNLRVIPASFFDLMPCLRVLNLSKTRIKSLPQSLSKLESLQALILRDCERLLVLPPEIGDLKSLELLDLKGTEISKLPDTIGGLVKLKHLKVSFYGSSVRSEYIKLPHILISKGVISSPALRELGIFVYPGDQRWMLSASDITTDVSSLKLCSLSFHFPSVEQLENFLRESPSWKHGSLAKYNFIVGQDAKRIVSQVSHDVELMYDQQDRCLRFVNGENIPVSVVEVLKCATSFYLDHHLSICSLSEFGIGNIQQLKFCIVRDCPKLEELINDTEFKSSVLPALEHLSINCLWNLRRIWCGHLPTGSFSQLRHLSVHGCPQLTFLLTCSMIGGFSNLKELIVEDCPLLEDVVREEEAPAYGGSIMEVTDPPQLITSRVTSLRKLEALRLHYLPKLSVIWKGPWPSLKYMSFYNCPNLKNLHLDSSVEASIEQIKAEEYWWDSLAWDDTGLSSRLRNHVTYISDGADSGVNLKSASSVGKHLNDSTSKGSSFSVAPMPRSEGEILLSPNLESSSDQIKEENLESPGFSELGMATSKCHLDSVLGEGGFTNKGSSFSVPPTPGSEGEILQSPNLKSFTFSELKTATRNFRPDSILGEGAFGPVFKGWIEEDAYAPSKPGMGMAIAVRKLHPECYQGHKEWLAHVNYLGLLCHPHLVRLLGYCLEDEHRLLVYEFMPRGSLENHLFRRVVQPLSWNLRLKVALGAAKGLAFLHNAETIVIHWDFKTSNVLLDSNYNAKLSDFWLAKDWPSGGKSDVSRRVTGTYGYIAPEYVATGHLYAKSTVYSYGVVLLEMLSGQRAVDRNRPPGRHNLVEWARPYLTSKRKVIRILDNRLKGQYNLDAAHKAATIAFQCLSREAKLRPTMAEVVKELEQLHDFMETGSTHNSGSGTGIKSANKYRGCLQFKSRYSTHPGTSASSLYAQRKGETHPGTYSSCDSA